MKKIKIFIILISIVLVFIIFKKQTNASSQNITADLVGEKLCDLFIASYKSPAEIIKIKYKFSLSASNTEIYLCLSSFYFLSFIRASQAENITIPAEIIEKISHSLASFLVSKYIVLHGINEDIDELLQKQNKLTQKFMEVWDKNLNSEPSPHWYVGKEIDYLLKGESSIPDPVFITFCAETFSSDTIAIKEFLEEIQKIFNVEP